MCKYDAQVCTPLLCVDAFQKLKSSESSSRISGNRDRKRKYTEDTDDQINEMKPATTQPNYTNLIKKHDSIRDILQWTLGNKCLYKVVGWWAYEFCHGRYLRQFHEETKLDPNTGFMTISKDSLHDLGRYDSDILESFPKVDESKYIVRPVSNKENRPLAQGANKNKQNFSSNKPPHDDYNEGEKQHLKLQNLILKKAMTMDLSDLEAGGSGVVFIQEYFHGDFCQHPDVTESVIKGGSILVGGIERATTVRFSCGNTLEFAKVKEDSTCHYIIDIILPELCKHHFFMAPVVKTKVVKCLLVDEQ